MTLVKKKISVERLNAEDFTPKVINNLTKTTLTGLDLYFPDILQEKRRFEEEIQVVEDLLGLKSGAILKLLRRPYRPSFDQEDYSYSITLPYFSTMHEELQLGEKYLPIEISTNHFLILFQKPNIIVTIRTDPKNYSLECVSIVMNWIQQIEQGVPARPNLLDQVIVRLIDEIIDDNVEVIRRFRENAEFFEQAIIRKITEHNVLDQVLNLKGISMHLYSHVLSEKRFLTRLRSAGFPGLILTDEVLSVVKTSMNEIESQTGIINDINRTISDIINIYSLLLQNRMNNVLKVLTVWSVIFLLPTFIVGFFGMNNFSVSEINPAFSISIILVLVVSIVVPIILLWGFKMFKRIGL